MTKFRIAQTLTASYLFAALALSFVHIAALFALLGAGREAWIAPLMIDAVAVIGKISMGSEFTAKTRAAGRRALYVAGSVSFVANVTVGYVHEQYGSALLGAIVVIGALWAESHLAGMRPTASARRAGSTAARKAAVPAPAANRDGKTPEQVKRSAAARKAAATRQAKAAAAAAARQAADDRAYI